MFIVGMFIVGITWTIASLNSISNLISVVTSSQGCKKQLIHEGANLRADAAAPNVYF